MSIFRLDKDTTCEDVPRTRSLPQGDLSAPMIFGVILDTLAEKFLATAAERRWGQELSDGSWVNLILFADNYSRVATSLSMLRGMANEWLRVCWEVGWGTATADLTGCTRRTSWLTGRPRYALKRRSALRCWGRW